MKTKQFCRALSGALLILASGSAALAETARLRAPVSLLATPNTGAAASGSARAGAAAQILERRGFWAKVAVSGASGWVKLSSLSLGGVNSSHEIAALASGRSGQGNVVSATGGRGLDNAADLTKGAPDPAAVAGLSALAVTSDAADRYARAARLTPRALAYTPAPKEAGSP